MPIGQYPCLTGCPIVLKPLIQTKVVYTLPKAWFKDIALSGSCRVHSMSEVSQALQETEHYRNLFNPLEQFLFSHFWDWFIGTSFHLANILSTYHVSGSTLGAVVATKINKNQPLPFENIYPFEAKVCILDNKSQWDC